MENGVGSEDVANFALQFAIDVISSRYLHVIYAVRTHIRVYRLQSGRRRTYAGFRVRKAVHGDARYGRAGTSRITNVADVDVVELQDISHGDRSRRARRRLSSRSETGLGALAGRCIRERGESDHSTVIPSVANPALSLSAPSPPARLACTVSPAPAARLARPSSPPAISSARSRLSVRCPAPPHKEQLKMSPYGPLSAF